MKIGLGLYERMLTQENLQFARQTGATHIVVHMADYLKGGPRHSDWDADAKGRSVQDAIGKIWSVDELVKIRKMVEQEGLQLAALENFNPALWYDVLLDGPLMNKQLADLSQIIINAGKAEIPCIAYNFSLVGVYGRTFGKFARGGAETAKFIEEKLSGENGIPEGWIWNRWYNPEAEPKNILPVSRDSLIKRYTSFLNQLLPVAESNHIKLAIHPEDPPVPQLRGSDRMIFNFEHVSSLMSDFKSEAHKLLFCVGTFAEMDLEKVYRNLAEQCSLGNVEYIHLRNISGNSEGYTETFIDDGAVSIKKIIEILREHQFEGTIIPDHTPLLSCDSPWHSGMAFALGYIKGIFESR